MGFLASSRWEHVGKSFLYVSPKDFLTPEGELSVSFGFENDQDRKNWDGFYKGSFSLKEAGSYSQTASNWTIAN